MEVSESKNRDCERERDRQESRPEPRPGSRWESIAGNILLASLAVARGDVSLGYQYKPPQNSLDIVSHHHASRFGGVNGNSAFGLTSQGLPSADSNGYNFRGQHSSLTNSQYASYQPGVYNTAYQTSDIGGYKSKGIGHQSLGTSGYQTGSRYQTGLNYQTQGVSNDFGIGGVAVSQPSYQYSHSSALGGLDLGIGQFATANQYQSSAEQNYQEYYKQSQQQPVQVFKHFYVHAAPEEPEVPKFRQPPVLPPPQKHYKIIFIKTPTPPAPAPQFIPVQTQNEEKTIVYVLVKKPEEQGDIILPKVEPKPPSKPEVIFIKYKGKDGHQGVINNIVSDYNKDQASVSYGDGSSELASGANVGSQLYGSSLGSSYAHAIADGSSGSSQAVSLSSDQGAVAHSVSGESTGAHLYSTVSSVDTGAVAGSYDSGVSSSAASVGGGEVAHSGHSHETQNLESFNTINHENAPHQFYGPPH